MRLRTRPNHALQRTRRERRGCHPHLPRGRVAELGSLDSERGQHT
jgi:hypothetical protein